MAEQNRGAEYLKDVQGRLASVEAHQADNFRKAGTMIADAYAEYFQKLYPALKITVKNTGSGNGITALIDGRCDLATSSRFMKAEEFKKAVEKGILPVAHTIAMDGLCIAVNPANSILGLSTAQIKDLYTGKVKNWKEVGGPDMEVVVISRDTASGTYEAFNEMVMKKEKMADAVLEFGSYRNRSAG